MLNYWNGLPHERAIEELLICCGSRAWAEAMLSKRPHASAAEFLEDADRAWFGLSIDDWMEAFRCHPPIGATGAQHSREASLALSRQEQGEVLQSSDNLLSALATGNKQYVEQYGFTYIVCASGRSANELLSTLQDRLNRKPEVEIKEAAEQQRQITQLRLRRWLGL